MNLYVAHAASPLGEIMIATRETVLCALDFAECGEAMEHRLQRRWVAFASARSADPAGISNRLEAYFEGELAAFDGLETDPAGTVFQRRVWAELLKIPPGQTLAYGEIAANLGRASASRAVGSANGLNPIALVIPCHRVVGHDGNLRGYAGGLDRKRWLIAHEARYCKNQHVGFYSKSSVG